LNTAVADDSVCPDLPQHVKIRVQGESELRTLPARHSQPTRDLPQFRPWQDLPVERSLGDDSSFNQALFSGWRGFAFERTGKFFQAKQIFEQALAKSLNGNPVDEIQQRQALEALANLYANAGYENADLSQERQSDRKATEKQPATSAKPPDPLRKLDTEDPLWKLQGLIDMQIANHALKPLDQTLKNNLQKAEAYYKQAIALPSTQLQFTADQVHDELALSMLQELFEEPDAVSWYRSALHDGTDLFGSNMARNLHGVYVLDRTCRERLVPPARYWAIMYYIRHNRWSDIIDLQPSVVNHEDFIAIVALTDAYSESGRTVDAMHLFDLIAARTEFDNSITPRSLASLIELSDLAHRSAMCSFIDKWEPKVAKEGYKFDDGLSEQRQDWNIERVGLALWKKGWTDEEQRFYNTWLGLGAKFDDYGARLDKARSEIRNNRLGDANHTILTLISVLNPSAFGEESDVKRSASFAVKIAALCESSGFNKFPGAHDLKIKAIELQQRSEKREHQLQCLNEADRLDHTGWDLEKRGAMDSAKKMYDEALAIRRQNLPKFDRTTALDLVNVARINVEEQKYIVADPLYAEAIDIFQHHPLPDDDDDEFQSALQAYGDLLYKSGKNAKADQIYAIAKRLAEKH
jgi:tetratricopeptide (TPR) repeat protein